MRAGNRVLGSVSMFSLIAVSMIGSTAAAQDGALVGVVVDAPLPGDRTEQQVAPDPAPLPAPMPAPTEQIAFRPSAREIARMRASIVRELAARRRINLARFRTYVTRGVYPLNTYRPGMLNVFIDEEGHICAAATIMTMDGQGALVQAQARDNNFVRLADVRDGALYEWILASGFTQDELVTIQVPFFQPEPDDNRVREPSLEEQRASEKRRLQVRYERIIRQLRSAQTRSLRVAAERLLERRLAQQAATPA